MARRLERELLGAFRAVEAPLGLVNEHARVALSTEPSLQVGQLAGPGSSSALCAGTPFEVRVEPMASGSS